VVIGSDIGSGATEKCAPNCMSTFFRSSLLDQFVTMDVRSGENGPNIVGPMPCWANLKLSVMIMKIANYLWNLVRADVIKWNLHWVLKQNWLLAFIPKFRLWRFSS